MEAVAQLVEQRNVLFSLIPSIEWCREELLLAAVGRRFKSDLLPNICQWR